MSRDNIQIMDNQAFSIRATPSVSVLSNTEWLLLTSGEGFFFFSLSSHLLSTLLLITFKKLLKAADKAYRMP